MKAGISIKHIIENAIRVDLDDHGYGDVEMVPVPEGEYSWELYRNGNLLGSASYDINNIFLEIKD